MDFTNLGRSFLITGFGELSCFSFFPCSKSASNFFPNTGRPVGCVFFFPLLPASDFSTNTGRASSVGTRERQLRPNVVTYSALISACEKASDWPRALDILHGWGPRVKGERTANPFFFFFCLFFVFRFCSCLTVVTTAYFFCFPQGWPIFFDACVGFDPNELLWFSRKGDVVVQTSCATKRGMRQGMGGRQDFRGRASSRFGLRCRRKRQVG